MARVPEPVKVRLQRDVLESNDFLEPCGFRRFRDRVGAAADLAALVRRSGSRKRRGVDQSKGAAKALEARSGVVRPPAAVLVRPKSPSCRRSQRQRSSPRSSRWHVHTTPTFLWERVSFRRSSAMPDRADIAPHSKASAQPLKVRKVLYNRSCRTRAGRCSAKRPTTSMMRLGVVLDST